MGDQQLNCYSNIVLHSIYTILQIQDIRYKQMSTEEYNRKLDEGKKITNSISKDFKIREDKEKRGEPLFQLDAQIRGSFTKLDQVVDRVEKMFNNFRANTKDFGFTNKQLQKRQQQYQQLANERTNLKRQYDSYFQKKSTKELLGDTPAPSNKPDYSQMNKQKLSYARKNHEKEEDQVLDELIGVVKNTKKGNQNINTQLKDQDKIIDTLGNEMDDNIEHMGKVRRSMNKLLQQSSSLCLIIVILLEIAGIICNLLLWH